MTDTDNSKKDPQKSGQPTAAPSPGGNSPTANQNQSKSKPAAQASGQQKTATGSDNTATAQAKTSSGDESASPTTKDKTKAPHAAPKKAAKPKRPFPITAVVALALGLAVGAASYLNFSRWQITDVHTQSLANENNNLRSQLGELQQQISGLQRQDLDLNLAVDRLSTDSKLQNDSMTQLSQQFQALAADKGKDPMLWRSAEVEYLLAVANHRLILERDVNTALTALQDADRRLEAIGDPALIPVRKLIASETTALKSVDVPDIAGMALKLSSLVDNIEQLPLVSRERLKTDEAMDESQTTVSNFRELMAKIRAAFKGVVTIRRSDQPIEPLLPPEELHYLSQNLGLKLEEARIALLRRDTPTFRQNLTDSREWVQRYFDPEAAAVSYVIATVDELRDVELKPQLPDISDSLREMRRWLSSQQQQRKASASPARVAKPRVEVNVDSSSSDSSTDSNNKPMESPANATPGQETEQNI
jgi:uroporphyrin-3 C-methyltransferase